MRAPEHLTLLVFQLKNSRLHIRLQSILVDQHLQVDGRPIEFNMTLWNLWGSIACVIALQASFVLGAPLVQDLGHDLTILTDNDLVGNTTSRTTGAILIGPVLSYSNAEKTCALLNEKLWSPQSGDFDAGLNNSLSYHVYSSKESKDPSGLYWVAKGNSSTCNAVTAKGKIEKTSCDKPLPALCTQSAPMAHPAWADTSPRYQISQRVGRQILTGFRDFHTFRFHGVRFAPQPKRFELSTLYEGEGQASATQYGYDCIQQPMPYLGTMSEDCLFMNIWTPYLPTKPSHPETGTKLKPVLFWIYGGGDTEGSGTDPEKEGGQLASRGDIVVVEFNYRLGALGWLTFKDGVHNGNYGLSDQLNALRWINKYISAFGGDPRRITIWGESAGASGVRSLLASPLANGLFSGAIMQSAPGGALNEEMWANYSTPLRLYEKFTKKVLAENGCTNGTDDVECLRAGDPHKWAESGRTHAQFHSRDGNIIPFAGLPLSGRFAKPRDISLAIGSTRDEAAGWLPYNLTSNFRQLLSVLANVATIDVMPLANLSIFNPEFASGWSELSTEQKMIAVFNASQRLATEGVFTCLTTATAYSATKNRLFKSVYQFEFNRTYIPDNTESTPQSRRLCGRYTQNPDREEYYKCHSTENPVVFGNPGFLGWPDRDGTDVAYSRLIVDYWSTFARTGKMDADPSYLRARGFWTTEQQQRRAGAWKQYSSNGDTAMRLQWTGQKMFAWGQTFAERCRALGYPQDYYEGIDFLR